MPTQSLAQVRADLHRLAELVYSSRAAFGVRFDPVGERIMLIDDKGALVSDDRALLVVLDLVAAERKSGRVALPVTTTRVAEEVCRYHGVEVDWTPTSPHGLYEATAADDVIFAADGRGGFVVPEFSRSLDGIAAFTRLIGLVARTRLSLSPDPRENPGGAPAQTLGPDPMGGQGQRDADHRRGGGKPEDRHHRRRQGHRATTAAGRSSCPTPPPPSRTCGPKQPTARPPRRCWTSGRESSSTRAGSAAGQAEGPALHCPHVRQSASLSGPGVISEVCSVIWRRRRGRRRSVAAQSAAAAGRASLESATVQAGQRQADTAWQMDPPRQPQVAWNEQADLARPDARSRHGVARPTIGRHGAQMPSVYCPGCGERQSRDRALLLAVRHPPDQGRCGSCHGGRDDIHDLHRRRAAGRRDW